jgi:hypothetical protein
VVVCESGGPEVYGVHSECVDGLSSLLNVIEGTVKLSEEFVSLTANRVTYVFDGVRWIPA